MMHVLKLVEWESGSGRWHAADTSDLTKNSSKWWYPMRLLGLTPEQYVQLLIEKYNASGFKFFEYDDDRNSLLLFSFEKQADCHKFVLDINRIARQKNFKIY